jgi:putative endonuclease
MYFVYVLRSIKYGTRYVGNTQNVDKRLEEHNTGRVRYTKGRMPWTVVCTEQYQTKSAAMKREKFLKSGQGRGFLDSILS